MIRIISLLAVPALALFTASCGCQQAVHPPKLRNMPNFKELPAADAGPAESVEVTPTK